MSGSGEETRVLLPSRPNGLWAAIKTINIQLATRVVTAAVNLSLARFLDPVAFGTAHVSWGLFETLSLCLLREGFRRAALRAEQDERHNGGGSETRSEEAAATTTTNNLPFHDTHRIAVDIARLGALLSLGLVAVMSVVWILFLHPGKQDSYGVMTLSTILVALGMVFQVAAEPYVVAVLLDHGALARTRIESLASVLKTFSIPACFLVLCWARPALTVLNDPFARGALALACGQCVYGLVWYVAFVKTHHAQPKDTQHHHQPPGVPPNSIIHVSSSSRRWWECLGHDHKQLIYTFSLLAVQKVVLNEVERGILVILYPASIWPIYALVTNLGGAVCRLIFAPIEDLATVELSRSPKKLCVDQFSLYFNLESLVGLAALSFGRLLSGSGLLLLYGTQWISLGAHLVLKTYCVQLWVMAMNGPCEALMYSVGDSAWLQHMQWINVLVCSGGVLVAMLCRYDMMWWFSGRTPVLPLMHNVALMQRLLYSSIIVYVARLLIFVIFVQRWMAGQKLKRQHTPFWHRVLMTRPWLLCQACVVLGGMALAVGTRSTQINATLTSLIQTSALPKKALDDLWSHGPLMANVIREIALASLTCAVVGSCCAVVLLKNGVGRGKKHT